MPKLADEQRPITRVMLMGESAVDERCLDVMRDALKDVISDAVFLPSKETFVTETVDPAFAAARCAAKVAKRELENLDGCLENAVCRWRRRQVG